jgi:hypothetical protein
MWGLLTDLPMWVVDTQLQRQKTEAKNFEKDPTLHLSIAGARSKLAEHITTIVALC